MEEKRGAELLLKYIGALRGIRVEPRTMQVLLHIIYKCYDQPEIIPHQQFEEQSGLTKSGISRAIGILIKNNIINRVKTGRGYMYSMQPNTAAWVGDPEKKTTTGHHEFVEYFCNAYKDKFGINYKFDGPRDGKLVKNLLRTFGLEDLKKMVDAFFEEESDEFLKKIGKTLPIFSVRANTMAQRIRGVSEPSIFGKFDREPGPAGY